MKPRYPQDDKVPERQSVLWFASPGDPATLTGGYIYNARVIDGLTSQGWDVRRIRLPDAYPFPSASDQATAKNLLFEVGEADVLVIDGLALGAFSPDVLGNLRGKLVALVHHPLADESGLDETQVAELTASETLALRYAKGVIVTSPHTGGALVERFEVARKNITVAIPGVDRPSAVQARKEPPIILSVGSLTARKGHDVLVRALATIVDLDWQANIVGSCERDPEVANDVRNLISNLELQGRVSLSGEFAQSDLAACYGTASVFALATRHEGYGMVFSEAMMHGLPIVTCAAGAVPDTVPASAGILVPVDDEAAFASALRSVLSDRERYQELARGSQAAGDAMPSWADTARIFGEKCREVRAL